LAEQRARRSKLVAGTIYPIDGKATPVTPREVIQLEVPDMYGRPWAHIWEEHFEQGMQKPPPAEDIFDFN
jgi:hypothetical protein